MRSRRRKRTMNRWTVVVVVMKTCGYWIECFPFSFALVTMY